MHHILIDKLYRQITDCINRAAAVCIPTCKQDRTVYNVPGWNTYVAERHETARNAYLLWLDSGILRHGYYFDNMKKTRAQFKLALRYCRQNVEEMKANACAQGLLDFDPQKFWKNVNKISNSNVNAHVTSLGGVSGQHNIADVWKNHFEKLYSSKSDSKHRINFECKLLEKLPTVSHPVITVADVSYALGSQKRRKAAGPDGLPMEAFMFAGHRLHVLLFYLTCLSDLVMYRRHFVNRLLFLWSNQKLVISQTLIIIWQSHCRILSRSS